MWHSQQRVFMWTSESRVYFGLIDLFFFPMRHWDIEGQRDISPHELVGRSTSLYLKVTRCLYSKGRVVLRTEILERRCAHQCHQKTFL